MDKLNALWDTVNIPVPPHRVHLFEILDLPYCPPILRQCAQAILTWQWSNKLPLVQWESPAEQASRIILRLLDQLERDDPEGCRFTILDFCSGSGGPVPAIEALVNAARKEQRKPPVDFVLSDLHPPLDDWIPLAESSAHIKFLPQPVDATNPPRAASDGAVSRNILDADEGKVSKVVHLYALCFHHFTDAQALQILRSMMKTADAFAILELQERRMGSLLMMMFLFFSIYFVVALNFWRRPTFLFLTFLVPILPTTMWFDGTVSSLRTRTLREVWEMARVVELKMVEGEGIAGEDPRSEKSGSGLDQWRFQGTREMHTLLVGYLTCFAGVKTT